jgi:hypothetical protein
VVRVVRFALMVQMAPPYWKAASLILPILASVTRRTACAHTVLMSTRLGYGTGSRSSGGEYHRVCATRGSRVVGSQSAA